MSIIGSICVILRDKLTYVKKIKPIKLLLVGAMFCLSLLISVVFKDSNMLFFETLKSSRVFVLFSMILVFVIESLFIKNKFRFCLILQLLLSFLLVRKVCDYDSFLHMDLFIYMLMAFLCMNINYKTIIKFFCFTYLVSLIIVLVFNENSIVVSNVTFPYNVARQNLGLNTMVAFTYVTFYLFVYYIYLRKRSITFAEIVLLFVITLLLYYLQHVKGTCFLMWAVLIASVLLKYVFKDMKYNRYFGLLLLLLFAFLYFGIVFLSYIYEDSNELLYYINGVLHGRLSLGKTGILECGISLFGNFLDERYRFIEYFYVDSSYLRILLLYGIIGYLYVAFSLLYFIYLAHISQDTYLIVLLFIVFISCAFNMDMFYMIYNNMFFILSYQYECSRSDVLKRPS